MHEHRPAVAPAAAAAVDAACLGRPDAGAHSRPSHPRQAVPPFLRKGIGTNESIVRTVLEIRDDVKVVKRGVQALLAHQGIVIDLEVGELDKPAV